MTTEIYDFRTPDGLTLPGILFKSDQATKTAAIFIHGNGTNSVFYSTEKLGAIGTELNRSGIDFFTLARAGAAL